MANLQKLLGFNRNRFIAFENNEWRVYTGYAPNINQQCAHCVKQLHEGWRLFYYDKKNDVTSHDTFCDTHFIEDLIFNYEEINPARIQIVFNPHSDDDPFSGSGTNN